MPWNKGARPLKVDFPVWDSVETPDPPDHSHLEELVSDLAAQAHALLEHTYWTAGQLAQWVTEGIMNQNHNLEHLELLP